MTEPDALDAATERFRTWLGRLPDHERSWYLHNDHPIPERLRPADADLALMFAEWNREADAVHRQSLRRLMLAGRYHAERNRAVARFDALQSRLGDVQEQWTVGRRAADGIIDWSEPPPYRTEAECRDYVALEVERGFYRDDELAVGSRLVGSWQDADRGPAREMNEEELADWMARFKAALAADSAGELLVIPPDDEDLSDVESDMHCLDAAKYGWFEGDDDD